MYDEERLRRITSSSVVDQRVEAKWELKTNQASEERSIGEAAGKKTKEDGVGRCDCAAS